MDPPKASWAQIVETVRNPVNPRLDYYEPLVINGIPVVAPPEEVRLEGSMHWKTCLVGHFVGKRPTFPVVTSIAKNIWSKFGLQEVIAQANGFVFFMFAAEEGMTAVLERGSWFIAGRFLVLKRWERNLNLSAEAKVSKLPVWALLYNVPVEYWTPKGLSYISSAIRKHMFADTITLSRRRLNFARVCVEIEARAPLIEEFALASGISEDPCHEPIKIKVVYKWKLATCSHCMVFGHSLENCTAIPTPVPFAEGNPKGKELAVTTSQPMQTWTRVGRKNRYGTGKQRSGGSSSSSSQALGGVQRTPDARPESSIFQVLEQVPDDFASTLKNRETTLGNNLQNSDIAGGDSAIQTTGQPNPILIPKLAGEADPTERHSGPLKSPSKIGNQSTESAQIPAPSLLKQSSMPENSEGPCKATKATVLNEDGLCLQQSESKEGPENTNADQVSTKLDTHLGTQPASQNKQDITIDTESPSPVYMSKLATKVRLIDGGRPSHQDKSKYPHAPENHHRILGTKSIGLNAGPTSGSL